MSEPTDAEWEAAEEDLMYRQIDDWYDDMADLRAGWEEKRRVEEADRAAKILLTVIIVLLFLAVMWAAQTELRL